MRKVGRHLVVLAVCFIGMGCDRKASHRFDELPFRVCGCFRKPPLGATAEEIDPGERHAVGERARSAVLMAKASMFMADILDF